MYTHTCTLYNVGLHSIFNFAFISNNVSMFHYNKNELFLYKSSNFSTTTAVMNISYTIYGPVPMSVRREFASLKMPPPWNFFSYDVCWTSEV